MCARSPTKGTTTITDIKAIYPQAHITLLEMDHLNLASLAAAAKLFLTKETALHGLVNNAGIMATPFALTPDGYEEQWQTNYIAHWLFTYYLLPILQRTAKPLSPGSVRIVNLSSSGHYMAPTAGIDFTDTSLRSDKGTTRYGQSKLANILHAKTLHRLHGPPSTSDGKIWTSIVHPGLVATNIGAAAEMNAVILKVVGWYGALGGAFSADKGSWTSLFCVAGTGMKEGQSGTYFQRIAEAGWESGLAKDRGGNLAVRLEEWTRKEMEGKGFI